MEALLGTVSHGVLRPGVCAQVCCRNVWSDAVAPLPGRSAGEVNMLAWASKALDSFKQEEERRRRALAVAALAVSMSISYPAAAAADMHHFARSEHVVEDVSTALAPFEIQRIGFELQQSALAQSSSASLAGDGDSELKMPAENFSVMGERCARCLQLSAPVPVEPTETVDAPAAVSYCLPDSGMKVGALSKPQQRLSTSTNGGKNLLSRILQHLGGGGLAGAVGATVVYPLDTIKTRLQAQTKDEKYANELDCVRELLLEEGLGSLYNGLIPQLLGIAPEKALKLTVNEMMLGVLEHHLPGARVWTLEFIAGGGGGFSQVLVTNPMEVVKLRLQIQSKATPSKGLLEMVQELGFAGLYNGSGITLARDVPGSAIFFACYALLLQMHPDQRFWAGFLAAVPATLFVTPFDVIKTRLQMETPPGGEPYKDAFHCLRVLVKQEGLRGLFKGGLLRVLRTSPQFGITLLMYSIFCEGS